MPETIAGAKLVIADRLAAQLSAAVGLHVTYPTSKQTDARAILAIDSLAELVIAGYWMDRVGRVRAQAFFNSYLQ
jgi:hypothetical protein